MANMLLANATLFAEERDPFISILDLRKQKSAVYKKIDLSKAVLKGIIWNKTQPVAIINDELAMIGDEWQGYKVERIDKDSVLLSDEINTYKLNITEEMPALGRDNLTAKPGGTQENEIENRQGVMPPKMQGAYPDRGYMPGPGNYPIERRR